MNCPNCDEDVKPDWKVCPKCHADLTLRKYSKADDPLEKLQKQFNKIDEFLTEKFPIEEPKDDKKGKGKRKTLFGD